MAHCVSGIVTTDAINEAQRIRLGLPLLKTKVSSFLAVSDEIIETWAEQLNTTVKNLSEMTTDEGPNYIDNNIVVYFTQLLEIRKFALIETEYHGGDGIQSATIYKNGNRITQYTSAPDAEGNFISDGSAINTVLKELAITPLHGDLFQTVGLDKFRFTNDYYTETS